MANNFTLDIRECMMLGEAIGEIASERALIRATAISCITEDGKAIEKNINAYAVSSSDGLAGVRGTLVERSSQAIINSMAAGFLSGFADAASPQQVTALNTNPSATSAWQDQNIDQYAGAGMMKGAGNAMNKVADYYTAIAEAMWPVIEVPAGIEIDFIVQTGMTLQLEEKEPAAQAAPTQRVNSDAE
jgi:conjugal transfer pilus assembly protein TraB